MPRLYQQYQAAKWVTMKFRYSNIELLIFEPENSIVRLLSANNTYFRDNTVYIVLYFVFFTANFLFSS